MKMTGATDPAKMASWAEQIDDEDEDLGISHQEVVVKDGERIVSEIKTDSDSGKKIKISRTFKLEKKLVSKHVIERKSWTKFGHSKRDQPGPNSATTVVADEVQMQFISGKEEIPEENPFAKMQDSGKQLVRCRYCQDAHFSAKCPYKDVGLPPDMVLNRDFSDEPKKVADNTSEAKPGIFVPRVVREGKKGETMGSLNRKDDATIRVSNLPESMSETDMQELCNPFGKVERIFLAKDRTTGVCKGFAFVTYQAKENAARALRALNGYGYDHLILNVEWSKPTAP